MIADPPATVRLSRRDEQFIDDLAGALMCPPADSRHVARWLAREGTPGESLEDALTRRRLMDADAGRALRAMRRACVTLDEPGRLFGPAGLTWLGTHFELAEGPGALPGVPGLSLGVGDPEAETVASDAADALGLYRLGAALGRGHAGAVFEGESVVGPAGRVAVKVLPAGTAAEAALAARYARGAERVAALKLSRSAPVLEVGREFGFVYVVTPVAAGGSAESLRAAGRLGPAAATEACAQAARALAELHAAGFAHGNVRAGNLLMGPDGVLLADAAPPDGPGDARPADVAALRALHAELLSGHEAPAASARAARAGASAAGLAEALEEAAAELTRGQTSHARGGFTKTVSVLLPARREPAPGDTLGRVVLDAQIGRGATGVVFRGEHQTLGVDVAVKVLSAAGAGAESLDELFASEARVLARLNHPNIVRIWDFDTGGEFPPYLVLEWCDGSDLDRLVAEGGPLPAGEAVALFGQVVAGLDAAYRQAGVVHRDLKPANILVGRDGLVKVADLGLAAIIGAVGATGASAGGPIGTPAFMSPEQVRGGAADLRSDIYSLGVTMYQAVTGRLPFTARTRTQVMLKHLQEDAAPADRVNPDVPAWLSAVIARAMAKEPADRFQTHAELAAALVPPASAPALAAPTPAPARRRTGLWRLLSG